MSKYVKLEDIEAVLADKHMNRPLDSDRWVIGDIGKSIADLPTIDIVHCGECKCCRDELIEEYMPLYIYCEKWNHETDFDGFCKSGERIEE